MITDMTKGSPAKMLWAFSLPMLCSSIFQQMYNMADSIIAGRFIGEDALAAVGVSYPVTMIFMAVAMGCSIGCSVVISQLFGAKQYTQMKLAVNTSFISCIVLSVLLTVAGLLLCNPLMSLLNTPDNIFADSETYLQVYILGLFFLFLYNISTGTFTALGDSKTPLYFLIASSVANILLDLLFVTAFHMGVAGVAWATFLAQGAASVLAFTFLVFKMRQVPSSNKARLFSLLMLKKISIVAIPSILQQSFISVGNIIIQSVINGFGAGTIAGYSAAVKLNNLVITSFTTLANGISNFTAQNLGAGKIDRIHKGFKAGLKMVWIISIPLVLLYFFAGKWLLYLFLDNPTTDAINTGITFLCILSPFYFIVSTKLVADGILRGSGLMGRFMIATFTDLILRVVLAIVLSGQFGSVGIWCAWPIGWTTATILSVVFYRSAKFNFTDTELHSKQS